MLYYEAVVYVTHEEKGTSYRMTLHTHRHLPASAMSATAMFKKEAFLDYQAGQKKPYEVL